MKKIKISYFFIGLMIFLFILPNLTFAEGRKLKVIVTHANLRDLPGMKGKVVGTVTSDMVLEFIKESGNWYQVLLPINASGNRISGYVHSSMVEFITEPQVEEVKSLLPPEEKPKKIKTSKVRKMGFGFKLSGGMSYLLASDVNDGNEGNNNYWELIVINAGGTATKDVQAIKFGLDFKGEIVIYLTGQFGLALGGGYINGSSASEINYTFPTENGLITTKPIISAIPVTLSLFYNFSMSGNMNLFISAGGGVYFASYSRNCHMTESGSPEWTDYQDDATAVGFGFHGNLGFEFKVSPNLSIVFEGMGRYASISGFEGTNVYSEDDGYKNEETGKLYYFEGTIPGEDIFKIVEVRENPPAASPFVSNVREAKVDFSGFGIRIGFLIRLGR